MSVDSKDFHTLARVEVEMILKIAKKATTSAEVLDTCKYLGIESDQYWSAETTVFRFSYYDHVIWVSGNDYGIALPHTMEVSWHQGKLQVDSTDIELSRLTLDWEEPIGASSDSLVIADAITAGSGVRVLSVDHDDDIVFVHVLK